MWVAVDDVVTDPGPSRTGSSVTGAQPPDSDRQEHFLRLAALVHEPLRRYALRRVDPADADDIVAETLLVLWRRLDDVPEGAELPWSYNVARNCVANLHRSAVRRERLVVRLAAEPPAPVDEPPAYVAAALGALSDRDREVVLLWAWEGLTPREIAVVLGTSANAVSLRLSRAKRRLRSHLARHELRQDPGRLGQKTGVSGKETR
jgi:RNA polymerase sigma-70 factor, ECF subfamily